MRFPNVFAKETYQEKIDRRSQDVSEIEDPSLRRTYPRRIKCPHPTLDCGPIKDKNHQIRHSLLLTYTLKSFTYESVQLINELLTFFQLSLIRPSGPLQLTNHLSGNQNYSKEQG
jgi:hypothetical protein